ncbi:2,3-diaminopropionate biosynthesis protein SbnB [Streptomyces sp. NPDC101393]|uniref:2,3-diaminopropionate biosynthesis protein SbnB n=1 Tax=Streptomyces sp. NPDC101393 TaxID=3366141 RepID=UPI003804AEC3
MNTSHPHRFSVVTAAQVDAVLRGRERETARVVEEAYRLHGEGATVNPPSAFLRFADRPDARIIALPASLGGAAGVDGIKWISSVPANPAAGLPRASAVILLNDQATGRPVACVEGSLISAARTAASAVLAADRLSAHRPRLRRLGVIGAGLIARQAIRHLTADGWVFDATRVYDTSAGRAAGLAAELSAVPATGVATAASDAAGVLRESDLVVVATVAGDPHLMDPRDLAHGPLVLHLSLRDFAPEVLRGVVNVVDDVDHALREGTSLQLTAQQFGASGLVDGTLHEALTGALRVPDTGPVVFSPFGLGVLDLALAARVLARVRATGDDTVIEGFLPHPA